jgi:hypothetical protein
MDIHLVDEWQNGQLGQCRTEVDEQRIGKLSSWQRIRLPAGYLLLGGGVHGQVENEMSCAHFLQA